VHLSTQGFTGVWGGGCPGAHSGAHTFLSPCYWLWS
jgi:hypothetical protein